jgi:hypothetical protein
MSHFTQMPFVRARRTSMPPFAKRRSDVQCRIRRDKRGEDAVRFRTTVLLGGKTATGIEVPAAVVTSLGAGKRPPVQVTINGYTYRSTVAPMGRDADAKRFFDGLSYSNKRRLVLAIEGAKSDETRQRRIAKTVDNLREGRT